MKKKVNRADRDVGAPGEEGATARLDMQPNGCIMVTS